MEIWKDVEDYQGYYQVSNCGRVRALERIVEYTNSTPRKRSAKILKMYYDPAGYLTVRLCKGGKAKNRFTHRLVAKAFIPNPNEYPNVNHKNAKPDNNEVDNLEWCTQSQNNMHSVVMGNRLHLYGSNHHMAKINEKKAIAIHHLLKVGMPLIDICYVTNTSYGIVRAIKRGKTWKHVL